MADVALAYDAQAPLARLQRALALYGHQRWAQADEAFAAAMAFDTQGGGSVFRSLRRQYLKSLCEARPDPARECVLR
jgi:hypothetical protein